MSETETEVLGGWLWFAVVIALYVTIFIALRRRARRRLYEWAIAQGYDILGILDPPLFRPSPFFMRPGRGWAVARIVVRTTAGAERIGWVCYPAGFPLFEPSKLHRVELVWEDEWDRRRGPFGPFV
ncbi:MAG: hypothetical protein U0X20_33730 [Caldilineaceae bacterium]